VHDTPNITRIAKEYYKVLFSGESRGAASLGEHFWESDNLITSGENDGLTAPFSKLEIKEAVFGSYSDGAPGPDGLSFLLYQKFWDIVKGDLFRLVKVFQDGKLDLFRLNYATLTLITKVEDASKMKNFRPISMLNCSFKIFGRLLTSKLEKICERIVAQEQSAFIRGRYILESVVVAQEVVHTLHRSKEPGVVIKSDYEKVYDRVNLDFLFENLRSRGFSEKWVEWIKMLVLVGLSVLWQMVRKVAPSKLEEGLTRVILYPPCCLI
jgi:hypothetical protein